MQNNIQFDLILPRLRVTSRKQFFDSFSYEISQKIPCSKSSLVKTLEYHEMQQSSAIGDGIAIPHIKMRGLKTNFIALATLTKPVIFETPDEQPVDLVALLLSPEKNGALYLKDLSRLSRLMHNKILAEKLREAQDIDAVKSVLINPEGWLLAA